MATNEVSEPQLIPYRKNDKWGFCTSENKIVIDSDVAFLAIGNDNNEILQWFVDSNFKLPNNIHNFMEICKNHGFRIWITERKL